MSAELALLNQILVKSLKQNVDGGATTFKVPVTAGVDITEGDSLQINPADGKVYPSSFTSNTSTGEIITGTDTVGGPSATVDRIVLDEDTFCYVDTSDTKAPTFRFMKYDSDSSVFKQVASTEITDFDLYTATGYYTKIKLVHNDIILLVSTIASDKLKIATFKFDSDYAVSIVASSEITTNDSNDQSSPIKLDARRYFIGYTNDKHVYRCIDVDTDGTYDLGAEASLPDALNSNQLSGISFNSDVAFIHKGNSGIAKVTADGSSGTDITIVDKTDDYGKLLNLLYYTIESAASYKTNSYCFDSDNDTYYFLTSSVTWDRTNDLNNFIGVTWDSDDGDIVMNEYTLQQGFIGVLLDSQDKIIKISDTEFILYKTYPDESLNYGHKLYKITIDDSTNTYKIELIAYANYSDGYSGNTPSMNSFLTVASDGNLVGAVRLRGNDGLYESFLLSGEAYFYTPVKLVASTGIQADEEGIALADGIAFANTGSDIGSIYLNRYMITDTNYAVELR